VKILKFKFTILYNNGIEETFIRDTTEEKVERIAEVFNTSFQEEMGAVVRLNDDNEAILIRVSQVSRVKIEKQ
jgi:hypothetical protein